MGVRHAPGDVLGGFRLKRYVKAEGRWWAVCLVCKGEALIRPDKAPRRCRDCRPFAFDPAPGVRIGRSTLVRDAGRDRHGNDIWVARCECGYERTVVVRAMNHDVIRGYRSGVCVRCHEAACLKRRKERRCRSCGTTNERRFSNAATECDRCARRRIRNGSCPRCLKPRSSCNGVKRCTRCREVVEALRYFVNGVARPAPFRATQEAIP